MNDTTQYSNILKILIDFLIAVHRTIKRPSYLTIVQLQTRNRFARRNLEG